MMMMEEKDKETVSAIGETAVIKHIRMQFRKRHADEAGKEKKDGIRVSPNQMCAIRRRRCVAACYFLLFS